mgnify:CR=1 FL=1
MRGWIRRGIDALAFALRRAHEETGRRDRAALAVPPSARETGPLLRTILRENIVPFWSARAPDSSGRGYRLHHDHEGVWKGPGPRSVVGQSRTLWSFARLAEAGLEPGRSRASARIGFRFLRDRMWDAEHGGFFWAVDHRGDRPADTDKLLYGQAFAIYGLSRYAQVADDPSALRLARRTFELLEDRLRDGRHGGYHDVAARDWSTRRRPAGDRRRAITGRKTMNSHLHLMEALSGYCSVAGDPVARDRLGELVLVLAGAVVRREVVACTELFEPDWTPVRGPAADRVSYGHDVENVALLMDACRVLGRPDAPLLELYRALFANALRHGYDRRRGGFYAGGPLGRPADRREKVWWVQAEGLAAALRMFLCTGDPVYQDCYLGILRWLVRHQIDWERGSWHATVTARGRPEGDKASGWKTPYHSVGAVLTCLELLEEGRAGGR